MTLEELEAEVNKLKGTIEALYARLDGYIADAKGRDLVGRTEKLDALTKKLESCTVELERDVDVLKKKLKPSKPGKPENPGGGRGESHGHGRDK